MVLGGVVIVRGGTFVAETLGALDGLAGMELGLPLQAVRSTPVSSKTNDAGEGQRGPPAPMRQGLLRHHNAVGMARDPIEHHSMLSCIANSAVWIQFRPREQRCISPILAALPAATCRLSPGVWRFASTAGTSEVVQSIAVLAGGISSNHRGPLAARGVQPLGTRRKASGDYDEGGFTGTTARHEEEIRRWVARSAPRVIARSP